MYVGSCYKISTSKYENPKVRLIFPRYCTYLLMCCVIYLKNDDTVPNAPTINRFLETTSGSELREWYNNIIIK